MKVCLTYANWRLRKTQRENGDRIIASGFFDKVIFTSPRDLSKEFVRDYKHILKYGRGAGYWVWKPYIIKQTLMSLSSEDILCYVDADYYFDKPIDPAIEMMMKWNQDIMPFGRDNLGSRESIWTKRDTFILMDCDKPQWVNSSQRVASLSLWRGGSTVALSLLDEWMHYAKDVRIITDLPSQYANDPDFRENRHDQSIFSLLTKKYNLRKLYFPGRMTAGSKYHFLIESFSASYYMKLKIILSRHIFSRSTLFHPLRVVYRYLRDVIRRWDNAT